MRPMMALLLGGRAATGGGTVSISNETVTSETVTPTAAEATYSLLSDGQLETTSGGLSRWLIGSSSGSNYECRATIVSGTLSSGTTGSWLALSSNRAWAVTRVSLGTKTCTIDVEIGLVGTSTALDTARIILTATVDAA